MRLFYLIIPATLAIVFSIAVSAKEPTAIPEIEMVEVEGGTFTMGLDEGEAEHMYETPKHEVTLSDFRIGKYEVTQELWEDVMGENPSISKGDELPVENVSWYDVQIFIKKLNKQTGKKYRLPTEAEWEYAARGGNLSEGYAFIGGNEITRVRDKNFMIFNQAKDIEYWAAFQGRLINLYRLVLLIPEDKLPA